MEEFFLKEENVNVLEKPHENYNKIARVETLTLDLHAQLVTVIFNHLWGSPWQLSFSNRTL